MSIESDCPESGMRTKLQRLLACCLRLSFSSMTAWVSFGGYTPRPASGIFTCTVLIPVVHTPDAATFKHTAPMAD